MLTFLFWVFDQMSPEFQSSIAPLATKGGAAISVSSAVVGWVNQNASVITVAFGFIGVLVALLGAFFQYRRHEREKELHAKQLAELSKQLEKR